MLMIRSQHNAIGSHGRLSLTHAVGAASADAVQDLLRSQMSGYHDNMLRGLPALLLSDAKTCQADNTQMALGIS